MKWIKASEKTPPEVGNRYFVKFKNGEHLSKGTASTIWKDGKKKEMLFVNFHPDSSHYIVDNVYQWLDEEDNEWIDVKDRLPEWDKENAVEVLMMGDSGVFFGVYYGKFQSVYLFALGDRDGEINDITHWRYPPTKKQ